MGLGSEDRLTEIYQFARHAYHDLNDPDYGFFADGNRRKTLSAVINRLRQLVDVTDWSDYEDGVSLRSTLEEKRHWWQSKSTEPIWTLWLSAVGPFGLLLETPVTSSELSRDDVVMTIDESESQLGRRITGILREEGVRLLAPADVEATVGFKPYHEVFPVTAFVMLFEEENVPWWHPGE